MDRAQQVLRDHQIRQGEQTGQSRRVFGKPLVATSARRWPSFDQSALRRQLGSVIRSGTASENSLPAGSPGRYPWRVRSSVSGPLRAWPAGLLLSRQQVLQRGVVEHRVGQQALEPVVLLPRCFQALGFGDRHSTELRFPVVVGRFRAAVLATQLCRLQASLGVLQNADDLLFVESLFHRGSYLEWALHRHRTSRGEQVGEVMSGVSGGGSSASRHYERFFVDGDTGGEVLSR